MKKKNFQQVFQKAIENGWDNPLFVDLDLYETAEKNANILVSTLLLSISPQFSILDVIYDKSFGKALWGECDTWFTGEGILVPKNGWQYHFQRMIINNSPFDYLLENA